MEDADLSEQSSIYRSLLPNEWHYRVAREGLTEKAARVIEIAILESIPHSHAYARVFHDTDQMTESIYAASSRLWTSEAAQRYREVVVQCVNRKIPEKMDLVESVVAEAAYADSADVRLRAKAMLKKWQDEAIDPALGNQLASRSPAEKTKLLAAAASQGEIAMPAAKALAQLAKMESEIALSDLGCAITDEMTEFDKLQAMSSALTLALAAGRVSPSQHRAYAEAINAGMMLQAHIDILRSDDTLDMLEQIETSLNEREKALGGARPSADSSSGPEITWGRNHRLGKNKQVSNDQANTEEFEI